MSFSRIVSRISKGVPTKYKTSVKINRIVAGMVESLDPFLLLDEIKTDKNSLDDIKDGFPSHPHRGFETVTYMLNGSMEHKDSKGNKGLLTPGSLQWMTAGRGIIHSEMPIIEKGDNNSFWGFQLWVNLPSTHKMMEPRYQDIKPNDIPIVNNGDGVNVKVLAGKYKETNGPVKDIVTHPLYLDVELAPGAKFYEAIPVHHTAFVYVFKGNGQFGPDNDLKEIKDSQLGVLDSSQCQSHLQVIGGENGCRFILVAGAPIKEPVVWTGPYVMNTTEEIKQAIEDFKNGKFC